MGIRISEMEEATTFGADDYVPIVTNGTNKKALGAKIKNFIAGFFVNKSGDSMTGDLNINSNNARTKYINPNMTLDTSANNGLSSDSSYGAFFTDKNGNAVGDISMTTRSTGRNYAQLMARNKKTDGTAVTNYIDVIANKDGSSNYFVSNPAAFREAIYTPTYNFANLNRPNMHIIIAKVLISVSGGTGTFDMTPYLPTGMYYSSIVLVNATSTQSFAVTGATIDSSTNILTVKVSNQSASSSTDFNVLAFAIA